MTHLDDYLETVDFTPLQLQRERVLWRDHGVCQLRNLGLADHKCRKGDEVQCAHIPDKQKIKLLRRNLAEEQRNGRTLSEAQRRLVTATEDEVVGDPRGAVTMCSVGHSNFDLLGQRGRRDLLPDHVLEFVAEYGLEGLLDRLYGEELEDAA